MRLFDYITRSPNAFADWALRDKEAGCLDREEHLYIGLETSVVLFKTDETGEVLMGADEDGNEEVHQLDGATAPESLQEELREALVMFLNMEVDDDGNPVDV